jgi:hypothetical protein
VSALPGHVPQKALGKLRGFATLAPYPPSLFRQNDYPLFVSNASEDNLRGVRCRDRVGWRFQRSPNAGDDRSRTNDGKVDVVVL